MDGGVDGDEVGAVVCNVDGLFDEKMDGKGLGKLDDARVGELVGYADGYVLLDKDGQTLVPTRTASL